MWPHIDNSDWLTPTLWALSLLNLYTTDLHICYFINATNILHVFIFCLPVKNKSLFKDRCCLHFYLWLYIPNINNLFNHHVDSPVLFLFFILFCFTMIQNLFPHVCICMSICVSKQQEFSVSHIKNWKFKIKWSSRPCSLWNLSRESFLYSP